MLYQSPLIRCSRLASTFSCRFQATQILSHCSFSPSTQGADSKTHTNLLTLSSSAQSLRHARQTHALGILNGLLPHSVSLCASLILTYANFGDSASCRHLFEQTVGYCRTAFLWNTLIRAHSIAGLRDGFRMYNSMVRSGVRPDDHTFPFVLKACSDLSNVRKGMELHGVVFKLGFDTDVYVGNTLLMLYGNCGRWSDARRVFDEMLERDVVSWNTIIGVLSVNGFYVEALEYFVGMSLWSDLRPNAVTVITALPVCAGLEDEVMTSLIHCYVVKVGLDLLVTIGNALVDAYGKCGNVKASKQVFEEIADRNEVSWNAVITSLTYRGHSEDAFDVFLSMIGAGMKPNTVTISSMLPVLVELESYKAGREMHGFSVRTGMVSDVFIANSLIDMYAKSGRLAESSYIFHHLVEKNIVSWNAMVANYAQNGLELTAIELIRHMQECGEIPNSMTFTNVLPACARLGVLSSGKEIHGKTIRVGLTSDLFVSNALTDMYAKCGCLSLARNVFDTSLRDFVSYNILILGYCQTNECSESLSLFSEMRLIGLSHDIVSFVGAIAACANLAAVKQGKEIHGALVRRLVDSHLFVSNSLLDFYTKCGRIDLAGKVFDRIPNKDAASWNAMILGYGMLGDWETAISIFEAMGESEVQYDSVSYLAVLSACSHGGLVEQGWRYFKDMLSQNFDPTEMHFACMVDLLGRAGLMEEAAELVRGLAVTPDANIWGALLGACRIYGNVELGCWAAEHLFELKPGHSGYYVLLSNMYAEAERWEEANRIRELMKSRRVRKSPGCSWVQIGDRVHAFIVGERAEGLESASWLAESG